jgi:hypothetical protein
MALWTNVGFGYAGVGERGAAQFSSVAACPGVQWRATVDEDGQYCFAVTL